MPPEPRRQPRASPVDAGLSHAGRARRWVGVGVAAVWLAGAGVLGSIGEGSPGAAAALVLDALVRDAWPAWAYLLGSVGLGLLVTRRDDPRPRPLAWRAAVGLSVMLTLSHALGVMGSWNGSLGRAIALAPIALGIAGVAWELRQFARRARMEGPTPKPVRVGWIGALALGGAVSAAVLVVAACNPPGWLWDSEFGGFDALSYHLQLPREWLAAGRVWPLNHNVYSYLPGYFESAFAHLGAVRGLGSVAGTAPIDSAWLLSCQLLHAGCAGVAAWTIAAGARRILDRLGVEDRVIAWSAGLIALGTPWVLVVGSLAYNEMPMLALTAAAAMTAVDEGITPARRGAWCGWLVGVACGVKPTALVFGAPMVGLLGLVTTPARSWAKFVALASVCGLLALSPWMARNAAASGNPVFPYASSIFGDAHWTGEQHERFSRGHHADEPVRRRAALLVVKDSTDPAGARHRGMLHPQWGAFFPVGAALAGLAVLRFWREPKTRALTAAIAACLVVQTAAWMFATHLQSRFLIPLLIPGAWAIAAGLAGVADRALARGAAVALILVQTAAGVRLFAVQHEGRPNTWLLGGPGVFSGSVFVRQFEALPEPEREPAWARTTPEIYCSMALPAGSRVYLLGGSTPLYLAGDVVYHTTWDRSPLGDAVRRAPDDPGAWGRSLLDQGITHVLFNPGEIGRLTRSGWYDPAVTPLNAARWLGTHAVLVRAWEESGQALYALKR